MDMLNNIMDHPLFLFIAVVAGIGLLFLVLTIYFFSVLSKKAKLEKEELPDLDELDEELPDLDEDASEFAGVSSFDIDIDSGYDEYELGNSLLDDDETTDKEI